MKKFSILIFALFMWVGQAQSIADYEYVYVPKNLVILIKININ